MPWVGGEGRGEEASWPVTGRPLLEMEFKMSTEDLQMQLKEMMDRFLSIDSKLQGAEKPSSYSYVDNWSVGQVMAMVDLAG